MLKQYIKLFAIVNVFFVFYTLGIILEKSQSSGGYYGGFFAFTFLPAVLFFIILYGCYSYVRTKNIILPNLLLLILMCLYYFGIFYLDLLGNRSFDDFGFTALKMSLPCVGISVLCGLIIKFTSWLKIKLRVKKNNKGMEYLEG